MATYTPAELIATKVLGNGSGNISTWRTQTTAAHVFIYRTVILNNKSGASSVTLENGPTSTAVAAEEVFTTYALTALVPAVLNMWEAVAASSYFKGYANSVNVGGQASGYDYA